MIYSTSQRKKVAESGLKSNHFALNTIDVGCFPLCKTLEFFQEQKSAQVIFPSQGKYQIYLPTHAYGDQKDFLLLPYFLKISN